MSIWNIVKLFSKTNFIKLVHKIISFAIKLIDYLQDKRKDKIKKEIKKIHNKIDKVCDKGDLNSLFETIDELKQLKTEK